MGGGILLNKTLDLRLAGMHFVAILLFTLLWEFLTEELEEHLEDKPHFLQMLSKIYRELMILGFISLVLVLSLEFSAPWVQNHHYLIHFEFAHIVIFFWACVYTLNALIASFRLSITRASWDRVSNTDTEQLVSNAARRLKAAADPWGQQLHDTHDHDHTTALDLIESVRPDKILANVVSGDGTSWNLAWVSLLPTANTGYEDVEWKILQRLFLRNFKLPGGFDYSKYLQQKLNSSLAESLEVHPKTWGIVIMMTLVANLVSLTWGEWGMTSCIVDDYAGGHRRLGDSADISCEDGSTAGSTAGDGHRRQLGGGGGGGITGPKLTPAIAHQEVVAMLVLGWLLALSNAFVVFKVKKAIIKLITNAGGVYPKDLPTFLLKLDAQLQVRKQMSKIAMFRHGGDEFFGQASNGTEISFWIGGDFQEDRNCLAKEGDTGDSMFFLVHGTIDIVDEASKKVLVTLPEGSFCGEMSLLLGDPRSKSMYISSSTATIATLNAKQLVDLEQNFEYIVSELRDMALRRKGMAGKIDTTNLQSESSRSPGKGGASSPRGATSPSGNGSPSRQSGGSLSAHKQHKGSKMMEADEVDSNPATSQKGFQRFTELCLLLNCFYMAFYWAHIAFIVIPKAGYTWPMFVNLMLLFPSVFTMFYLAPMGQKVRMALSISCRWYLRATDLPANAVSMFVVKRGTPRRRPHRTRDI